jgi:arsenite-transporting ATPase
MLKQTAVQLFGDEDPSQVMFHGETQTVTRKEDGYEMTIPLPFVEKEEVELIQMEYELIVKVGKYKRDIILPRVLAGLKAAGARFEESRLILDFKLEEEEEREEEGEEGEEDG